MQTPPTRHTEKAQGFHSRSRSRWDGGKILIPLALLLLVSACMVGPKFKTPEVPIAQQWREAPQSQFTGQPVTQTEWWKGLNDPILNSLIEQAFAQNLTLQGAALRIVQARIGRSAVGLSFLPLITGTGSISHSDFSTNVKPEVEITPSNKQPRFSSPLLDTIRQEVRASLPSVSISPEMDVYDAGFDAIWELDLWGKKRQRFRSSSENLKAAYAAYDAMMISLAADVARTYVEIRTVDQRLAVLKTLLETMNKFVAITEERFQKKEALVTDVKLAKLLTGIVQTSIPQLESARRQLENSLCVLLGKAPQDLHEVLGTGSIPAAPTQSLVGIPADLLRRRPDVRLAEHLAAAECARVGMAKASILPSFSIFGAIGLSSSDSENFFKSDSVRSAYGGLLNVTNLILYPITVQNVRLQDARFEEAQMNYRETVLRANLETENALYAFLKTQDEGVILEGNVKEALDTANLTMEAYKQGKVIVSVPLVALTFLSSQQDQLWARRGDAIANYIAIYKALGGGWQNRVDQELVPEHIREQMKQQADWWSFTGKWDLNTKQEKR